MLCNYICGPVSSEGEEEAEDSLRGDQPLPRAGSGALAEEPQVHFISQDERIQLLEHAAIYHVGPKPPEAAVGLGGGGWCYR